MTDDGIRAPGDVAESIEDTAADWLWQRSSRTWGEEDEKALEAWLAAADVHRVAFWRLESVWDRTQRLGALRRPNFPEGSRPNSSRMKGVLGAVAAVTIAAVAVWAFQSRDHRSPPSQTYSTAIGGRATIKLADGSKVELNTDTTISAEVTPERRTITLLRGEAYFQIRHNSARPFVVLASGHRIVDLGTKFSVRASGDTLKVTLVEGRARLETANAGTPNHSTELTPGEVVVATANSMAISKQAPAEIADALSWKRGLLVFRHARLSDAAREFNRYNHVQIAVAPDIAALRINGTFASDSVDAFTRMAEFAMKLKAEKSSDEIRLTR